MKEKDFDDTVRKLLRQDGWGFESTVQAIKTAAEAAGVTWDHEELELPERLQECVWGCAAGPPVSSLPDDGVVFACFQVKAPDIDGEFPGVEYRKRVLGEAVRRYNAWPKLREKARAWEGSHMGAGSLARGILAILDGKEA